ADGLGAALVTGREPGSRGVDHHPPGHDDPRRGATGRARPRRHHRRPGPPLGWHGRRGGPDRRPGRGPLADLTQRGRRASITVSRAVSPVSVSLGRLSAKRTSRSPANLAAVSGSHSTSGSGGPLTPAVAT